MTSPGSGVSVQGRWREELQLRQVLLLLTVKNSTAEAEPPPPPPPKPRNIHVRVDVNEDQTELGAAPTLTYGNGGSSTALSKSAGDKQTHVALAAQPVGSSASTRLRLQESDSCSALLFFHHSFTRSLNVTKALWWKQGRDTHLVFQHFTGHRRDKGGKKMDE